MKKKIISLLLFVVCALAAIGYHAWQNRTTYLSEYLSGLLAAPVTVQDIGLSFDGVMVKGLTISNPYGSKKRVAFSAETIRVSASPFGLMGKTITVREVIIENGTLGLEMYTISGEKSNWSRLLNNLSSETSGTFAATEEKEDGKGYVVQALEARNMTLEVRHPLLGRSSAKVSRFRVKDLGQGGTLSSKQTLRLVLRTMLGYFSKIPKFKSMLKSTILLPKTLLREIFFPGKEPQAEFVEQGKIKPEPEAKDAPLKEGVLEKFRKMDRLIKDSNEPKE